jgi:hypothetical protein
MQLNCVPFHSPLDAAALGIAVATAERWWAFARARLYRKLQGGEKNCRSVRGTARLFALKVVASTTRTPDMKQP